MTISELSKEEKIKLSEQYKELNDVVKQREELDAKMLPLYDKLSELEVEEEKLNKEYNEILSLSGDSLTSEHTLRLADVTSRNVELSKEKETIKRGMIELSEDFFNIRKEESILKENIEIITNKKEGSIFSGNDEVVRLDKNGSIVDKINVDSSNFSKIISGAENNINKNKNSITKATTKVLNVIKTNYKNTKPFTYSLGTSLKEALSKFAASIKSKADEIVDEFKKGYHEEEERIKNIINHCNKIKEEQEMVETEANNLKFIEDNDLKETGFNFIEEPTVLPTDSQGVNEEKVQDKKNNINQNLYYPRLEDNDSKETGFNFIEDANVEAKAQNEINSMAQNLYYPRLEDNDLKETGFNFIEEPTVLPADSQEVKEAKEIDMDEVVRAININPNVDKNISSEDNINIFANIDKFDEELQNNIKMQNFEAELKAAKNTVTAPKDQFANSKQNKVAKSNPEKRNNLISLFEAGKKAAASIGKKAASIASNKMLKDAKKDAINELNENKKQELDDILRAHKARKQVLEDFKKKQIEQAQNDYTNGIDNIENIFSGKSMAA